MIHYTTYNKGQGLFTDLNSTKPNVKKVKEIINTVTNRTILLGLPAGAVIKQKNH